MDLYSGEYNVKMGGVGSGGGRPCGGDGGAESGDAVRDKRSSAALSGRLVSHAAVKSKIRQCGRARVTAITAHAFSVRLNEVAAMPQQGKLEHFEIERAVLGTWE